MNTVGLTIVTPFIVVCLNNFSDRHPVLSEVRESTNSAPHIMERILIFFTRVSEPDDELYVVVLDTNHPWYASINLLA